MTTGYEQELMHHYRSSAFKGTLPDANWTSDSHNPSCGDSVRFEGKIVAGRLVKIMFTGSGCVISQAAASMLAERIEGKTVQEIGMIMADDMMKMVKIPLGPNRARCALLALEAITVGMQGQKV